MRFASSAELSARKRPERSRGFTWHPLTRTELPAAPDKQAGSFARLPAAPVSRPPAPLGVRSQKTCPGGYVEAMMPVVEAIHANPVGRQPGCATYLPGAARPGPARPARPPARLARRGTPVATPPCPPPARLAGALPGAPSGAPPAAAPQPTRCGVPGAPPGRSGASSGVPPPTRLPGATRAPASSSQTSKCRSGPPSHPRGMRRTRADQRRGPPFLGAYCPARRSHQGDWRRLLHNLRYARFCGPSARWLETGRSLGHSSLSMSCSR